MKFVYLYVRTGQKSLSLRKHAREVLFFTTVQETDHLIVLSIYSCFYRLLWYVWQLACRLYLASAIIFSGRPEYFYCLAVNKHLIVFFCSAILMKYTYVI